MRQGFTYVAAIVLLLANADCTLAPRDETGSGGLGGDPAQRRARGDTLAPKAAGVGAALESDESAEPVESDQLRASGASIPEDGGIAALGPGPAADPSGSPIYIRPIVVCAANTPPKIADIAAGRFSSAVVAATFDGTAQVGPSTLMGKGGTDFLVAEYGPRGEVLWARSYGDSATQTAASVGTDREGNIHLFGTFRGRIDFGRGVSLVTDDPFGQEQVFVTKLNPAGEPIWARSFAPSSDSILGASKMAVDPEGRIAIAGLLDGRAQFGDVELGPVGTANYIVELDADGDPLWGHTFRGPDQGVTAVTFDAHDNVTVSEDDSRGVRTFLLRWSPDGTLLLDRSYSGSLELIDTIFDIAAGPADNLFALGTGLFGGFGDPTDGLLYLAALSTAGDLLWINRSGIHAFTRVAISRFGQVLVAGRELDVPQGCEQLSNVPLIAAAFDASGNRIGIRQIGPVNSVDGLASGAFGESLVAGSFRGGLAYAPFCARHGSTPMADLHLYVASLAPFRQSSP